jgi:hypothetical protein
MSLRTVSIASAALVAALVSGCADNQTLLGGTSNLTTAAVTPPAPKADPVCAGLASQIDGLRKDAAAVKVEQASQKKAKVALTAAETAKVDQLNKANTEFQAKCSTFKPQTIAAPAAATVPATSATVAKAAPASAATAKAAAAQ